MELMLILLIADFCIYRLANCTCIMVITGWKRAPTALPPAEAALQAGTLCDLSLRMLPGYTEAPSLPMPPTSTQRPLVVHITLNYGTLVSKFKKINSDNK